MTLIEKAIAADVERDLPRAAELYEAVLQAEGGKAGRAFVNLMILYWQSTEFGYWAGLGLPRSFVQRAGERLYGLVESAIQDKSPNAEFWARYIEFYDLGNPFSESKCRWLLDSTESLDPVLYLFSSLKNSEFESKAKELLAQAKRERTVKGEYVSTVLESAFAQQV